MDCLCTVATRKSLFKNPPVFPAQTARFHPRINPISAPKTGPRQQSSKSFALRDQGHLVFTFTSMDSELKRWEARQQLILDVLESHVGPQREPAPDKPTRFGTICLNAVGNTASNKSTQLRVALKQATRFFLRIGIEALCVSRNGK